MNINTLIEDMCILLKKVDIRMAELDKLLEQLF